LDDLALPLVLFAADGLLSVAELVMFFSFRIPNGISLAATKPGADTHKNRRGRDTSGHSAEKDENSGKIVWQIASRSEGGGTRHLLRVG
jgi:hypothetical protein